MPLCLFSSWFHIQYICPVLYSTIHQKSTAACIYVRTHFSFLAKFVIAGCNELRSENILNFADFLRSHVSRTSCTTICRASRQINFKFSIQKEPHCALIPLFLIIQTCNLQDCLDSPSHTQYIIKTRSADFCLSDLVSQIMYNRYWEKTSVVEP